MKVDGAECERYTTLMRRTLPLVVLIACGCFGSDPYRRLAEDLADPLGKGDRRIAVLPFRDLESHDSNAGLKVAEALTTRLYRRKGLQLVERSLLDKVLDEHRVEGSGAFDEASLQRLGRLAGADAVVVGTLTGLDAENAEINARVVEMGTGRMLSAARARVPRPTASAHEPRAAAATMSEAKVLPAEMPSPEIGIARAPRAGQVSGMDFIDGAWAGQGIEVDDAGVRLVRPADAVFSVDDVTPLPGPKKTHGVAVWAGRIYVVGGESDGGAASADVFSAPVLKDGTLGQWRGETPLPGARYQAPIAVWDGRLFVFGGYGGGYRDDVLAAGIGEEGRLGAWTAVARLPEALTYGHAAVWAGRAYLSGGVNVRGNLPYMLTAEIQPQGRFGAWERIETGTDRGGLTPAAAMDRIYLTGGNKALESSKTVLWMEASAEGPRRLLRAGRMLPVPLLGQGFAAADGRLFILGGSYPGVDSAQRASSAVFSSRPSADGEPGVWTRVGRLPGPRSDFFGTPFWGDSLYVIGGAEGSHAASRALRVRVDRSAVRSGTYFGSLSFKESRPCRLVWKADSNGGKLRISVRTAAGGDFSSWRRVENGQSLGSVRIVEYRVDLEAAADGRSPLLREIGLRTR
ncbi:MAG: FlgO family outer membrane protein [Elusimicrobiota bacterium]|jgi:TolB-like protein